MTIRVLLADDHALFRRGLASLLEDEVDFEVVGQAGDGAAAVEQARRLRPDLVVMDVAMPGVDGMEATRQLRDHLPETRVVALSIHQGKRFVGEMLRAGARGYVLKKSAPEDLVDALRTVAGGDVYLSPSIVGVVVSEFAATEPVAPPPPDYANLVLRTKLHGPTPAPDLVLRTGLIARWEELRSRPLTIVSSPAGYGKSTLAAQWLAEWDGAGAWLSLNEEDNDLRVFVAGFIAAVRTSFPESCQATGALLEAAVLPSVQILSRQLLNDLDAIADPTVLVLDDYHRVRAEPVHDLMDEILRHPPHGIHLVLLTRRDPPLSISALRGRGQVTELGATEMRFSASETRAFLDDRLGFPIDEAEAAALHVKIEGWPAALRLVTQSIRDRGDLGQFLSSPESSFAGIADYLVDEVLSKLPPDMAEFLIDCSILDRFCLPLCEALDDSSAGDAGDLSKVEYFARLKQDNLFLLPLDAEGRWFRFHHLFQELLRLQLGRRRSAEELAGLHSRASRWFAAKGHLDEAIEHALTAGDVDGAAEMVEAHRHALLEEDEWIVLEKWLHMFPEEVVRQRPPLLLSRLWVLDYRFDHAELAGALAEADILVGADDPHRAEVDIFKGYLSYFGAEPERSLEHLQAALERLPEDRHELRAQAEMLRGLAAQMVGEGEAALERLSALLYRGPVWRGATRTRLMATVGFLHLFEGRLSESLEANEELQLFAAQGGYRHAEAWAAYLQGLIHLWRNELDPALASLERTVGMKYIIERRSVLDSLFGIVLVEHSRGRAGFADDALADLREFVENHPEPTHSLIAVSSEARLSLLRGEFTSAAGSLITRPPPIEPLYWWIEVPAVTHCRALLAEGSKQSLATARRRLEEMLALCRDHHNVLWSIGILSLLALVRGRDSVKQGAALAMEAAELAAIGQGWHPLVEGGPAMVELLEAAAELKPGSAPVREALAAIAAKGGPAPLDTGPLTEREHEVLILVGQGLSNKEIAARIYRSMETVKKHLYNTYRKLEVDGRIAALSKARELGILPRGDA